MSTSKRRRRSILLLRVAAAMVGLYYQKNASANVVVSADAASVLTTNNRRNNKAKQQEQQQRTTLLTSSRSISADAAQDFVHWRCGDDILENDNNDDSSSLACCWVYTGALIDPMDGRQIAGVQGIELIRGLATMKNSKHSSMARFRRRCRDLQISTAAHEDTAVGFAGTMFSRKIFCYTDVVKDDDDGTQLLRELRKRPGGPVTKIPLNQAVAVYDTAVSVVSPRSADNDTNNKNEECMMLLHTEWPNRKAVWSTASQLTMMRQQQADKSFEFTVYARPRLKSLQAEDLKSSLSSAKQHRAVSSSSSPARSALVQFGSSSSSHHQGQSLFGARETYRFINDNDGNNDGQQLLRYTRYGEAPVWYGPSRMCQLELTGRRIRIMPAADDDDTAIIVRQHVPVAAQTVARHIPNFWNFGAGRQRPIWMKEDESDNDDNFNNVLQQQRRQSSLRMRRRGIDDKDADPVFCYYADALQSALQSDANGGAVMTTTMTQSSSFDDKNTMSCADYRRYYADLAAGRSVDRFHGVGSCYSQMELPTANDDYDVPPWMKRALVKGSLLVDRIRAATLLTIGGGGGRE